MKRSPMPPRTTPLPRSSLPRQRQPLARVSAKRKAASPGYATARKVVRERSGGRCEIGTPVCTLVGRCAHHLAGRDGDRLTDTDLLAWTCHECHAYAHAHPAESYENGWMIRRNTRRAS